MKRYFFIVLVIFSFFISSCNKTKLNYSVTGDLKFNSENISRLKVDYMNDDEIIVSSEESEYNVEASLDGGEMLFSVPVISGGIYEVSWKDSWFEGYTASSIWVTGCESDTIYRYFNRSRILQMMFSPKVISVAADNNLILRVNGYNNDITGTYELNVIEVDKESTPELGVNVQENFVITSGQIKWYKFDVVKDSIYTVNLDGSGNIGAYGDEVQVNVTALRENVNDSYFEEAVIGSYESFGYSSDQTFTAIENETVYLGVCAAYWWEPREVTISLTKE